MDSWRLTVLAMWVGSHHVTGDGCKYHLVTICFVIAIAGLSRQNWAYIAYALTALTVIIWLVTLVMIPRIAVAVACIKVRRLSCCGASSHGCMGVCDC